MTAQRLLPLFAACLLAACQTAPPVAAPPAAAVAGRAQLVVAPTVAGGATRRLMAAITPWDEAAINHMVVKLFTVDGQGAETDTLQAVDVPNADLYNAISFTNLNFDTKYRVRAYAYKAAGDDADDLISLDSYVDLEVATDDRPVLGNLVVNLADRIFSGEATSSGLTVNGGAIVHDGDPQGVALNGTLTLSHVGTRATGAPSDVYRMVSNAAGEAFYTATTGVYKVATNGTFSTFATGFDAAFAITWGPDGSLYVGDRGGVWKVAADGSKELMAGSASQSGNFPTTGGTSSDRFAVRFDQITGLVVEKNGDLIVMDWGNDVIRRITAAGAVSDLTDRTTFQSAQTMVRGRDGNYLVADQGADVIFKVTAGGTISTFAGDGNDGTDDGPIATASFTYLNGDLAYDRAGWLYVADGFTVRRIDAAGRNVSTVAGNPSGPGSHVDGTGFQEPFVYGSARFVSVTGLTVVPNGEVLVGDSLRIRRLYNGL